MGKDIRKVFPAVLILSLALIQCQSFPFDPMGPPGMDGPGMDGPEMDGPEMDGPGMDGPGMDGCQLICCNPRYLNSIYDLYDDSQEADNPLESLCQKCECDGDESDFEYPDEFPGMPEFPDMPEFPEGPEIQRYLENMMLLKNMIILKSTMRNL